jgi:hypothetical protein
MELDKRIIDKYTVQITFSDHSFYNHIITAMSVEVFVVFSNLRKRSEGKP